MADQVQNFLPSILDRLIDDNPEAASDPLISRAEQLVRLRDNVRRDLEALLNHHRRCISPPPGLDELAQSSVEYGVPDFLSLFTDASVFREDFRRSMEDIIRRYEPRFASIKVVLRDPGNATDRTLRFRIDAVMYAEPAPEPVVFDSRLDPANYAFSVSGGVDG
jgi:type VI secretion system protein ImpF